MIRSKRIFGVGGLLLTVALLGLGCATNASGTLSKSDEMQEGYRAAKHGYWQEALMRFERARELAPNDVGVLNNVAVALEAVGRYEEAGEVYAAAAAIDPRDDRLKRNHRQFKDFYESYIAVDGDEEVEDAQ